MPGLRGERVSDHPRYVGRDARYVPSPSSEAQPPLGPDAFFTLAESAEARDAGSVPHARSATQITLDCAVECGADPAAYLAAYDAWTRYPNRLERMVTRPGLRRRRREDLEQRFAAALVELGREIRERRAAGA